MHSEASWPVESCTMRYLSIYSFEYPWLPSDDVPFSVPQGFCPYGEHNRMADILFKTPEGGLHAMLHAPAGIII